MIKLPIQITETEFREYRDEYCGICLCCGDVRYGETEPDAEAYPCAECGRDAVEGIENMLINGLLEIVE